MTTTSIISNFFSINGVVDTSKNVLNNMQAIASAGGAWVTYDVTQGKWCVVINTSGASSYSFDDSNIIGNINVSGTGLTELYNSVEISYPNADILDQVDYQKFSIAAGSRYPNEPDNELKIDMNNINNPAQAALLASRELKQSRVDKVIEFRTDFSKLSVQAGDLIDVTAEMYGFDQKIFRVISVKEEDTEDGVLTISITALEYDSDVYSTSGLTRTFKTSGNGIVSKRVNQTLIANDNESSLQMSLTPVATALGLTLAFNAVTGLWEFGQSGPQTTIDADSAIITWTFQDGVDLDIRARIVNPDVGQNTVDDTVGWTGEVSLGLSTYSWEIGGIPVLVWGGDNTGVGQESVYVNLLYLKQLYPNEQYFIVECRGNWYTTRGISPVRLTATLYQGGTVSVDGFTFTNSGYTRARNLNGIDVYVDSLHGAATESDGYNGATAPGDFMGYFIFDAVNNVAQFRNEL